MKIQPSEVTISNQRIPLYNLLDRVMDVRVRGSYGYLPQELRERGDVVLTAESTVQEFLLREADLDDDDGSIYLVGTDYYGRELRIPVDRVVYVTPKSTLDQAQLARLNSILSNPVTAEEQDSEPFRNLMEFFKDMRDRLVAAGVTEYVPKRAALHEM